MSGYEIVELGIDYVTMSLLPHQVVHAGNVAQKLMTQRQRLGDLRKQTNALGYKGEACGPVFFGTREDDRGLFRVSGPTAEEAFEKYVGRFTHLTRIDLQITFRPAGRGNNPHVAKTVLRESNRRRSAKGSQNYSHVRLIDGNGRGDTATIGSRSVGKFARIYDKFAESKDPRYVNCWRMEIEYKGVYADKVRDILIESSTRDATIIGLLTAQLDAWEVPTFIDPADPIILRGPIGPVTDDERSLAWLRSQVRPTIIRLRDNGLDAEVDEIVNL
jgi:hypothetical protein